MVAVNAVCVKFYSPSDSKFEAFRSHIAFLIDLHWLPYLQHIICKVCMLMFKCLKSLTPTHLVSFCTKGSAVSGRSALRSRVCGDLRVPGHKTDLGLRAFAVAGPSC